jgi:hypothetical protein
VLCCAVQASVYDLYDLLSLAADQLPPPPPKAAARGGRGGRGRGRGSSSSSSKAGPAVETEALATCARIVGELTPGSSAHVELATEYMVRWVAVLCCAVLCCAVLCCAVLCCAVLCCAVQCIGKLSAAPVYALSKGSSGVYSMRSMG